MSKRLASKKPSTPRVDPFLEGLMAKLLDRLASLERKMDTVVAQTSSRPATGFAPQARPAQMSFSNPNPMIEPKSLPRREQRTMYEAVCADCGDACEVPFRPSPDRSIYCKPCFAKRRNEGRVHAAPSLAPVTVTPTVKPAAAVSKPSAAKSAKPTAAKKTKKKK